MRLYESRKAGYEFLIAVSLERETCRLGMASIRNEALFHRIKGFAQMESFRSSSTCHVRVLVFLEGNDRFSKCFHEATCNETDDAVFDFVRYEKYNRIRFSRFGKRFFYELFGSETALGVQAFYLCEYGIHIGLRSQKEFQGGISTIHSSRGINAWSDMKTDDIGISAFLSFDKLANAA